MKYKVATHSTKGREESEAFDTLEKAMEFAEDKARYNYHAVYILRDTGEKGHPDSKGKFVLFRAIRG